MYRPTLCCRRNFFPSNWEFLTIFQNAASAGVKLLRRRIGGVDGDGDVLSVAGPRIADRQDERFLLAKRHVGGAGKRQGKLWLLDDNGSPRYGRLANPFASLRSP